jgi:pyruvate dehydrogenase E2 component (dihydrolipoamide acetyltransferase)
VLPGVIEQAIPHEAIKLSNIRKTIARRLTESKQQVPHIYLTVDIQLDCASEAARRAQRRPRKPRREAVVNDLLIKALAAGADRGAGVQRQLRRRPIVKYSRADVSVAVSIPAGLITPIIVGAEPRACRPSRRDEGSRRPRPRRQAAAAGISGRHRSLSQHGHVRHQAVRSVINPPQGMIMAIGAGEKRPYVINDSCRSRP